MNQEELKTLYNLCHIYGAVIYGQFPSWPQVKKANKKNRVKITCYKHLGEIIAGSIHIKGQKHQQSYIMVVMEKE